MKNYNNIKEPILQNKKHKQISKVLKGRNMKKRKKTKD